MPDPYLGPYSSTTFDRIGICDICQAPLMYVATSMKHNPDTHGDIHSGLDAVYAQNQRGYHVLPKPERLADDPVRMQAVAKLFFHKE